MIARFFLPFFLVLVCVFTLITCKEQRFLPLPKSPKRIAILNLLAAKLMWELGPQYRNHVVALPNTIDNRQYSDMVDRWPANIARISATTEEILLTQPDLVILASFNSIALRGAISKLNIPSLLLNNFTGFAGYKENIRKISASVQAKHQGKKIIKRFENRLNKIQFIAKKYKFLHKLNVLSYFYNNFAGAETSFNDIVQASGLKNLAVTKKIVGSRKGSQEEILLWNPDVIVIGCLVNHCKKKERLFRERLPLLKKTNAFKTNLIIAIDHSFLTSIDENMLKAVEKLQTRAISAFQ